MLKKITLAAAIAAISVNTGATVYSVSSNITAAGMHLGTANLLLGNSLYNGPNGGTFAFGGTAVDSDDDGDFDSSDLTFTGTALFNSGPDVQLVFNLSDGVKVSGGTVFTSGTIVISTDAGTGFAPYATVDASVTNIPFVGGTSNGHLGQATIGFALANVTPMVGGTDPGPSAAQAQDLPGIWNGVLPTKKVPNPAFEYGLSSIILFSNPATMYFEGTVTRAPVPIPAAAWLFGSALLGLIGVAKRQS